MRRLNRANHKPRSGLFSPGFLYWSRSLFLSRKASFDGLRPSGLRAYASIAILVVFFLTIIAGVYATLDKDTYADSVGPMYAMSSGDCVNATGTGTEAWVSPGNASANDNVNTTVSVDGTVSNYLRCTNYGFTTEMIPTGSTITGIRVYIDRMSNSSNNNGSLDNSVQLIKGGSITPMNKAKTNVYPLSQQVMNYGSETDLWGSTWSVEDITASDFGAAFSATKPSGGGSAHTISVDYIAIIVSFDTPKWTALNQRQAVIANDKADTVLSNHTARIGERMRVITQLDTNGGSPRNVNLKLQFDKNDSNWIDVGPGAEIRPAKSTRHKRAKYTASSLAGACLSGLTELKNFTSDNGSKTGRFAIQEDSCIEVGFLVDTKNAHAGDTYRFRVYDSLSNNSVTTYTTYPSFTVAASSMDRASKAATGSLASSPSDLNFLLDNYGYGSIGSNDESREMIASNNFPNFFSPLTIQGDAGDNLTEAMSTEGDFNGDGYDDIALGIRSYNSNQGKVCIFYGKPGGLSSGIASSTADVVITGDATADYFGHGISTSGDINGDGKDDLIISSFGYNNFSGRVFVFYGRNSMSSGSASALADVTWTGETSLANYGEAISNVGDINNDGYQDLMVGSYTWDIDPAVSTDSNEGRVYLYYGGTSLASGTASGRADAVLQGETAYSELGRVINPAGDVNGDGIDDAVISAIRYDLADGRVYILHGGNTINSGTIDQASDIIYDDEDPASASNDKSFGIGARGIGDVNGDGYDDMVASYTLGTGKAYIFFGGPSMASGSSTSQADIVLSSSQSTSKGFGVASRLNDINSDGYDDFFIGESSWDQATTTSNEGRVLLFFGGENLQSGIGEDLADEIILGDSAQRFMGTKHGVAGDTDGDGIDELYIGSNVWDVNPSVNANTNEGILWIYSISKLDTSSDATSNTTGSYGNNHGSSVASAGDVNGDGIDDVVVGQSSSSDTATAVKIYFGGKLRSSPATADVEVISSQDSLGVSVASAGDVNGDGYDDVIAGSTGALVTLNAGAAYIYYGGPAMDNVADVTMTGETSGNYLGRTVSSAGDVNGDGYDDVIVGAYGHNSSTGKAYIYYGGMSMDNTADITMTGEVANDLFGFVVASVGDVNNDGFGDVAVSSTGHSSNTGKVYIYHGGASMDSAADATMVGEAVSNYYGRSVANVGDVNGDGYDDVIVGAYGHNSSTGKAYIYYGGSTFNTTADLTLAGETSTNYFGFSTSAAGDVNGDGYDDIVIGAHYHNSNTGKAYLYYGGISIDTAADLVMTGEAISNNFGYSVSTAGDVNGDGYDDIVIGAPAWDLPATASGNDSGRAYLYLGGKTNYYPVFNLTQKHTTACSTASGISANWNGQSNVSANTKNILLQVFRFGATNAWETVSTDSSLAESVDGTVSGVRSSTIGEYCDEGNWSYWRLYQESGMQTLQTDEFKITFTSGSGGNQAPSSPTALAQSKVATSTAIAAGAWTNEDQIKLTASASDPDASDTLQLCVEVRPTGAAFTGADTSCGSGAAYSGSPVNTEVTVSGLTEGQYHWQARVKDASGTYSSWVSYGGNAETSRDYGVDTTAPTGTVYDGSTAGIDASMNSGSLTTLSGNWTIDSSISGLSGYEYSIGTTPEGTETLGWTSISSSTVTANSLSLVTSQIYYFNIRATDNAGNVGVLSSNGQIVAPTLTFSTSSNAVNFDSVNAANDYTTSQTITMTTATNAQNGYKVYGKATDFLTSQSLQIIGMFNGGTYATPAAWGTSKGFGYHSSDASVGGVNRFNSATCPGGGAAPCFAPYATTGLGDVVADNSGIAPGGPAINDTVTITNQVSIDAATQKAGKYQTTVLYSAYATY